MCGEKISNKAYDGETIGGEQTVLVTTWCIRWGGLMKNDVENVVKIGTIHDMMNDFKVKSLYFKGEQIVRVLRVQDDKVLAIDCKKCFMPQWIT